MIYKTLDKNILPKKCFQAAAESDPCHARKCTSNEHCCAGTVCVDTRSGVTGSCLPVFGKKAGKGCYADADCETGYVCQDSVCMVPAPGVGQFGESSHFRIQTFL